MCYTNILQILDLSGIPIEARKRTWDDPIVIGGGPCTYNPEPLAPFLTCFISGRERPFTFSCWISIRLAGKMVSRERNFEKGSVGTGNLCAFAVRTIVSRGWHTGGVYASV